MLPMGRLVAPALAAGVFFVTASALAQDKQEPAPTSSSMAEPESPPKSSLQKSLQRGDPGGPDAASAREKAAAGDCAGALPAFDAAITKTIEPTLRRDRGLCHEKLGHVHPAIDDYRAYLTAAPEASDAEQIRQRLRALEGRETASKTSDPSSTAVEGEANATLSIGGEGGVKGTASSSGSSDRPNEVLGPKPGEPERSYDYYRAQEKERDAADSSPLRYGSGAVFGVFTHIPRYYVGEKAANDFGFGVGGTLRYSTGRTLSLISELGYAGIGEQGNVSGSSGPILYAGAELRLPVSRYASDAILVRGGLGYERFVVAGTREGTNNWLGRFGLGFRHVFGPAIGLEALFDGGPALVAPDSAANRVNVLLGGSVAFVVGF